MSHLAASLPVVQYLHYHTKHCPPNPSEASLSLDGVLLHNQLWVSKEMPQNKEVPCYLIYFIIFYLLYKFFLFIYVFRICISARRSVFFSPVQHCCPCHHVAGIQRSKWHKIWHQPIHYWPQGHWRQHHLREVLKWDTSVYQPHKVKGGR